MKGVWEGRWRRPSGVLVTPCHAKTWAPPPPSWALASAGVSRPVTMPWSASDAAFRGVCRVWLAAAMCGGGGGSCVAKEGASASPTATVTTTIRTTTTSSGGARRRVGGKCVSAARKNPPPDTSLPAPAPVQALAWSAPVCVRVCVRWCGVENASRPVERSIPSSDVTQAVDCN